MNHRLILALASMLLVSACQKASLGISSEFIPNSSHIGKVSPLHPYQGEVQYLSEFPKDKKYEELGMVVSNGFLPHTGFANMVYDIKEKAALYGANAIVVYEDAKLNDLVSTLSIKSFIKPLKSVKAFAIKM